MPQPKFDRFDIGRFRSSFLPALLVVALGVTGVVTFQAYKASQEHRAVVESVLNAYVSFVAQEIQQSNEMGLVSCAAIWLYPAMEKNEAAEISHLRVDGSCEEQDGGRFDFDLISGQTRTDRVPPTSILREFIGDSAFQY